MKSADSSRETYLFASFLFLSAFLMRALSAHHGAPFCYHNDEHWLFKPAFWMTMNNKWDPEWYVYPPFPSVLFKILLEPLLWFHPMNLLIPQGSWLNPLSILPNQFPALYVGRLMVAGLGAGTCVLIFLVLRRFMSNAYATIASVLYSISPSVLFFSSYVRPEPVLLFFLTLTMYLLVCYQFSSKQKTLWIFLAGIALGFATGSKYNAIFFLLSLLLMINLEQKRLRNALQHGVFAIVGTIMGFLVSNPQFFFKAGEIWNAVRNDYRVYQHGHPGNMGSHWENFHFYIRLFFKNEISGYVGIVFLLSIFIFLIRNKILSEKVRNAYVVSSFFVVSYFAFICTFMYRAERVLVPVLPFVFISAALMAEIVPKLLNHKLKRVIALFLILLSGVATFQVISYMIKCSRPLPQDLAMEWIHQHAFKDAKIMKEFDTPFIHPLEFKVGHVFSIASIEPARLLELDPDYLILNRFMNHLLSDEQNKFSMNVSNWFWGLPAEFEDRNSDGIPLGIDVRILDFRKYKQEFRDTFAKK